MDEFLQRHYGKLPAEGGFAARCHMELPAMPLAGRRILNVGCRRGKGTYKLSELAGPAGFVLGIDWSAEAVEAARAGVPRALERSGLDECNMEFRCGFPEDLEGAGVAPASVDVAYLNGSLALFADPPRALAACAGALAPGGALVGEAVVAEPGAGTAPEERAAVVEGARALGNAVQAAPTRDEFAHWLADAGFEDVRIAEGPKVEPSAGSAPDRKAPTARDAAGASYRLVAFEARKPSSS